MGVLQLFHSRWLGEGAVDVVSDGSSEESASVPGEPISSPRASIRDVARRAGVSASTASRALRTDSVVASATRDDVLKAAAELAYSLPSSPGRHRLVSVLARFPTQWYFAEAIAAVEQTLSAADHRLVLHNIGEPLSRRQFFERVLPLGQIDGVVVVSASFDRPERRSLDRLGVPITVIGGYVPGYPCVGIDEEAAARTATEHLIGLGHRDLGMLAFAPDDSVGMDSARARARGFQRALRDNDLSVNPDWMIQAEGSRMAGGVRAAEQLLSLPRLPTAVFAMSDELAFGAIRAARRARLSVPGHLSIIGFDDHEMAEYLDLTTIRQPIAQQAREAARLLIDDAERVHRKTELPVRLVVRGTTAPLGVG
jgi:LacI family transcriptional regulator, repressor for deo operon, udp, cdd, tsx, nupC, and nupG